MYKFFTMAVAIAVMPLSQHFSKQDIAEANLFEKPVTFFTYKNVFPVKFWEPDKKPAQAWPEIWLAAAQDNIRKSEYHFKWEEKLNAFCTPNRKNNLRFFYNDKGFSVEPRTTLIPIGDFDPAKRPDEIKYKSIPNWKVKFNLYKNQFGKGAWKIAGNKAEYVTANITVQYINNEDGMRQNFIVHAPVSNTTELKIHFNLQTKLKPVLKNNRVQFLHNKTAVLHYEDLKVWDANGKVLTASFKKRKKNNYYIQVHTKDAVYPITIDPISTTPSALLESNQAGAQLGFSVAGAGDVNGDGYSDVIAGAHAYDNTQIDEGAAFIFHGSATGINTTPAAILESNVVGARLGISVSTAGDVNGDGFSDIVVGANTYSNSETWEGAVYIYHGSSAGINTTAAIMMESNQAQAQMGFSVACAGDVNADGFSDIIVGAWLYDNPEINEGVAFVYHGSSTGISGTIATTLEANQSASNFGSSVAGAGDVNGDGYSDVIVGAENYNNGQSEEGVVFVYHGSAGGINNVAVTMAESNQGFSQFGYAVSSAGDVNGDGYSDVIVGAYTFDNAEINEGAAFIYHGSVAGINNIAADTLEPNLVNIQFGVSVACAGDINGDGYSDVIVGAQTYDNTETDEGAAYVYFGSGTGINTIAVAILESNQAGASMGRGVASAGDVNGDGYSDIIAGAPGFDNGESNEGAAFVYHGSSAGLSTTPNSITADVGQPFSNFGVSVAGAGDVNGDGYGDVIIGAWRYDDGGNTDEGKAFIYHGSTAGLSTTPNSTPDDADQAFAFFAETVAGAGDVNGDGYSDVIIGADNYDDGGNNNEGRAFVYHGSASGLSSAPNSILDDGDQPNIYFGVSIACAGDVNGDGYSDVIVGAIGYLDGGNANEGRAFVYHGSAAGLSAIPNSTPDDANQSNAYFGWSVSGAGDVNGDGYSDVIIGALFYDDAPYADEGRAFIYHGSATGLSANPDAIPDDANQAGAQFGESVAGAGDVNGDGYSDVIIGARLFDDGPNTDEGRAFVYHGSAAGLSNIPNSTPDDADQAFSSFGISVNAAGDVNGDGYSDIIIGARYFDDAPNADEGRAFVYHGSVTGLSSTPNSTPDDANQPNATFGYSVANAGDVNGDGYSDIIVGAFLYTNGANTNEGRAFLYSGNEFTNNKRNNLRLYNTDLTTPVNSSNFVFGNFGAGLYAKSFLGRVNGKMVWETRLNFDPYNGTPITNSTYFSGQQAAYTNLGLAGVEIKNLVDKIWYGGRYTKIRARVKYDPVTAITGQVYGPWRNLSSVIDANNLGALPVDLLSFNAAWLQKGKTARLNFTTDKENGICCFDIEKSLDGFNFYAIGTLPAKNVSGIQSYSYIDNSATGKKQFYRLKIKGMAGQVDYSNMQQLHYDGTTEILLFPNPTAGVLHLILNKPFDKIQVQIINSSGQTVKQTSLPVTSQSISIPVQHLASGKYWLHLQSGGEKQVLQFVKQ